MKVLFLHGWQSVPGGVKPTFLARHGHEVINPRLPDEDFNQAVRIAQAEFDQHQPAVVVGSSRGGVVAMNIDSGDTPLVLLCPAWKKHGTANTVKKDTTILHSRADDVVPFADSAELVKNSGLPASALIEVGDDHRRADPEPLEALLRACVDACVPDWSDSEEELLQQDWGGLCHTAALRWVTVAKAVDRVVVHGTVWSEKVRRRIDHAWCERGEVVVDLAMPVGSRVIERQRYYRAVQPEIGKVYSSDDALMLFIRNGHQAPWDESEQLRE
jgi:hypothetical protein